VILHLLLDETPWLDSNNPDGIQRYVAYSPTEEDYRRFLKDVLPNVFIDNAILKHAVEALDEKNPVRQFFCESLTFWLEAQ
jgi:hypothetical protein